MDMAAIVQGLARAGKNAAHGIHSISSIGRVFPDMDLSLWK
jgi:hypothetical protein